MHAARLWRLHTPRLTEPDARHADLGGIGGDRGKREPVEQFVELPSAAMRFLRDCVYYIWGTDQAKAVVASFLNAWGFRGDLVSLTARGQGARARAAYFVPERSKPLMQEARDEMKKAVDEERCVRLG